jgi:hypothetical protein
MTGVFVITGAIVFAYLVGRGIVATYQDVWKMTNKLFQEKQ